MLGVTELILLFAGAVIGLLTSFVLWWATNHYLVASVTFAPEISRLPSTERRSGVRYRFKIKNNGARGIYDIKYRIRLKINHIEGTGSKLDTLYNLPMKYHERLFLKAGAYFMISPRINDAMAFRRSPFPDTIKKRAIECSLTLDDLLGCYPGAVIYVQVIATDSFSRTTKYFVSKQYSQGDIRTGQFKFKSFDIVRAE